MRNRGVPLGSLGSCLAYRDYKAVIDGLFDLRFNSPPLRKLRIFVVDEYQRLDSVGGFFRRLPSAVTSAWFRTQGNVVSATSLIECYVT